MKWIYLEHEEGVINLLTTVRLIDRQQITCWQESFIVRN